MTKISYTLKMLTYLRSSMDNQNATSLESTTVFFVAVFNFNKSALCVFLFVCILFSQPALSALPSIQLISPAHEATIRNTQGQVHISWVAHAKANVVYEIYLDDVLKKTTTHTAMALTGVERGAHYIYLQIKDKNGKVIAISPTHTIFVHQNSKLFR
ncbi:MAG: hypothetical protein P8N90_05170 [Glaciecola sp.]|nr:hypothetical protein [Glaciecola sp.]